MVTLPIALLIGFGGGLMRACQGAYKDSPYEPFLWSKFNRSLIFGTLGGIFWFFFMILSRIPIPPALFFPLVVLFDSVCTESYKRGIRVEDLSKYKMPTIFHINGVIVHSRLLRFLIVILFITFLALLYPFFTNLLALLPFLGKYQLIFGLFFGFLGGSLVSIGGCALDAPWEGFEANKFGRSAFVGLYTGVFLSFFTDNPALLVYGCLGMDRMVIEFHKTFVRRLRSGKFKSEQPTIPDWMSKRDWLVRPYWVAWGIFGLMVAWS